MSSQEPQVALLRRGGEIVRLSPLDYEKLREQMHTALRASLGSYTRDKHDPANVLIDALAACIEVLAFYHDRIATESKLGTAQLIESVSRLAEAVGYTPGAALAAVSYQFFEALGKAALPSDTRVSGRASETDPVAVFRTRRPIQIAPDFNKMALSPLLTRQTGAQRAVLRRAPLAAAVTLASPSVAAELFPGAVVMLADGAAVELATVKSVRSRGIAFQRPLLRSYADGAANESCRVARATRVRQLRFGCDISSQAISERMSLIAFEVSDVPILHLPDADDPTLFRSTLEVFLFDPAADVPHPRDWDRVPPWQEVADFTASEAADRHYRTFVDDRWRTYVVLRRSLGTRILLDDEALNRVYVRYVPAIGDAPTATLALRTEYFNSTLVVPRRPAGSKPIEPAQATWVYTGEAHGLEPGEQIAIFDDKNGDVYVRSLSRAFGRYLHWGDGSTTQPLPPPEKRTIPAGYDPEQWRIAPLAAAARGASYPLLQPFYLQLPESSSALYRGATFLLLEKALDINPGDYVLVGVRENAAANDEELALPRARWAKAEVAQVIEQRGRLLRLKEPLTESHEAALRKDCAARTAVVVPRVRSVYFGDKFSQERDLGDSTTFIEKTINDSLTSKYWSVAFEGSIDPTELVPKFGLQGSVPEQLARIFIAVSNQTEAATETHWRFRLAVKLREVSVLNIRELRLGDSDTPEMGALVASSPIILEAAEGAQWITLNSPSDAISVRDHQGVVLLVPSSELAYAWGSPGSAPLRVAREAGWYFDPPAVNAQQLPAAGTLIVVTAGAAIPHDFAYVAPSQSDVAGGLRLVHLDPADPGALSSAADPDQVIAIPPESIALPTLSWWADWKLADSVFPGQSSWKLVNNRLRIELEREDLLRVFEEEASAPLIVHNVEVKGAPDPAINCRSIFARPRGAPLELDSLALCAVWRFGVQFKTAVTLPPDWRGSAVFKKNMLAVRDVSSEEKFVARLGADLHELSEGSETVHLLHWSAGRANVASVWQWTGSVLPSSLAERHRAVLLCLNPADPSEGARLRPWFAPSDVLLLIASRELPNAAPVTAAYELFSDPIDIVSSTQIGNEIEVRFRLPSSWPSGLTALPLLCVTDVAGADRTVNLSELELGSDDDLGRARVALSSISDWASARLIVVDYSGLTDKSIVERPAVRVRGADWASDLVGQPFNVLLADFAFSEQVGVAEVESDPAPVSAIGQLVEGEWWLVRSKAATALPPGKMAYLCVGSGAMKDAEVDTEIKLPGFTYAPDVANTFECITLQLSRERRHFKLAKLSAQGSPRVATLDERLREVVGDTIPSDFQLDFAYAQSSSSDASECVGLHVRASGLKAGVLVFHQGGTFDDILVEPLVADLHPPGSWSLAPHVAGALFDAAGGLLYSFVSEGQSWGKPLANTFVRKRLVLELPPNPSVLQVGDRLVLTHDGEEQPALVKASLSGACYELGYEPSPAAVRVSALAVTEPGTPRLAGEVSYLEPAQPQKPWLLTFDPAASAGIADGLLPWKTTSTVADASLRRNFVLSDLRVLDALKTDSDPVHYYTNQRDSLRADLYENRSLPNFLVGDKPATALLVASEGPPALVTQIPSQVLLCPDDWRSSGDERFFERQTTDAEEQTELLKVYSTSLPFPSGDFIPVLGVDPWRDATVIRNALRVRLLLPGREAVVIYQPQLSELVEKIEQKTISSWDGVSAETKDWEKSGDDFFFYSFNKVPGGAFTLNFLLILPRELEGIVPRVKVYVEYGVSDSDDNHYKPEAKLVAFNPCAQLMLQDDGDLKPRDYLFVHDPLGGIQSARVTVVDGPLVDVYADVHADVDDAHKGLPLLPRDKLESVAVHGLAKPRDPLKLDKAYYAWLKEAQFNGQQAALTDKLIVDPSAVPFDGLFPGDYLLVFDRSYQLAWQQHRTSEDDATSSDWHDWPEYQSVAKVKAVDWETGLITLDAPLPSRFVATIDAESDAPAIGSTIEILPHYRAPLQGKRSRLVLGDGDVTRRFARYVGEFASSNAFHKLAALPLTAVHAYAGNIELIVRDPRSGAFTRFIQFAAIDDAEKKDRAFVPGVEPAAATRTLSFSVQLGDGKTGQLPVTGSKNLLVRTTDIESVSAALPRERAVNVQASGPQGHCSLQPWADDPVDNPLLTLESGAALAWYYGDSESGWRSLRIVVNRADAEPTLLREISVEQARAGQDGFVLRAARPGIVTAKLFTSVPITSSDQISVFEEAEASVWEPDWAHYRDLAEQDIATKPGAQRLSVLETDGLEPGSLLTFGMAKTADTELAEVKSVDHETWSIELTQPLAREYPIKQSFVRGNTVPVVQGDTELVTLGSADGVSSSLRFVVKSRAPLLYISTEGDSDPAPALTVYVDGTPWSRVRDLASAGGRDHVWSLEREPDGRLFVVFGDGVNGAVPNAGVNNVTARLHTGDGSAGNLAQGTIGKLVDGNRAVKSTCNITDANGGRAAEDAQQAREALLNRNVAFDRVVCAEDVERSAYELGEVEHARVDPTAERGKLSLVVSLMRRRELSKRAKQLIVERVQQRMPATAALIVEVDAAKQYPVIVSVEVVISADYPATAVLAELNHAFRAADGGFFASERWEIGEPLRLGDIYESIFAVEGVATAKVTALRSSEPSAPDLTEVGSINPGPAGIIRCDSDLVNDHGLTRGAIIFTPVAGGRA